VYGKTIADLNLRCLGLRRAASLRSFFRDLDGFDPIVQDMVAPRAWDPPTPPLATAFVFWVVFQKWRWTAIAVTLGLIS
jgi:hypothetical protein